jgi:hypothetical protein
MAPVNKQHWAGIVVTIDRVAVSITLMLEREAMNAKGAEHDHADQSDAKPMTKDRDMARCGDRPHLHGFG